MSQPNDLGQTIARRLRDLYLSQADLARLVGVSQQTVSKWVKGEARPRPERLADLADAVDVPARELALLATGVKAADAVMVVVQSDDGVVEITGIPASIAAKAGQLSRADQEAILAFIDVKLSKHSRR